MTDRKIKTDKYTNNKKCEFCFKPTDIKIQDDAFHSSKSSRFTEWWYFDAVFDNGYSIQVAVRILSIIKKRLVIVLQRLDIYKDGHLIKHNRRRIPFKKFYASKEIPHVKLEEKDVIKGYFDKKTGQLIFDLNFEIDEYSTTLRFEGITKGWKGMVPASPGGDYWAVSLPKANVTGTIKIKDQTIDVKGTGYHDHNWDVRGSAALKNLGWFWGKIYTKKYAITWATIFKNLDLGQALLVVNRENNGYINLKSNQIDFIGKDLSVENKKLIPHELIIKGKNNKVELDFTMKTIDIHHEKTMGFMNYWRYHLICNGWVKIGSEKEEINTKQIAELLRFK